MQQTYTYLWYCQTTNPLNVFVASKTLENTAKVLTCFSMYMGFIGIIYYYVEFIMSFHSIADRVACFIIISILIPVMSIFFYLLADILINDCIIRTYHKITQELAGPAPVGNGPFTYLNYFQTNNPNNIFVKSQTCNDATITIIKLALFTALSLFCFFNLLPHCEFIVSSNKCAIWYERIAFSVGGTIIIMLAITAIYFIIKGLYGCQQTIKDEIKMNTALVLTKNPHLSHKNL